MATTKELSFKLLEIGEKIPAKPWLWREWSLGAFQEIVRSPGNLLLKELESMDVRWFLRAISKEHRGRQFQSAGNQANWQKRAWQGRDLLEVRWTKEVYRLWKKDKWHLYRDAVCHCRERIGAKKVWLQFQLDTATKRLLKNVNNRRSRNDTGLLLCEVGHLKNRDMK